MSCGWTFTGWKLFRIFNARVHRVCKECLVPNIVNELNRGHLPSVKQHVRSHLVAMKSHCDRVSPFLALWGGIDRVLLGDWSRAIAAWRESLLEAEKAISLHEDLHREGGLVLVESPEVKSIMGRVEQSLNDFMVSLVDLQNSLASDENLNSNGANSPENASDVGMDSDLTGSAD